MLGVGRRTPSGLGLGSSETRNPEERTSWGVAVLRDCPWAQAVSPAGKWQRICHLAHSRFRVNGRSAFSAEQHRSLTGSPVTSLSLKMIQMQSWAGGRLTRLVTRTVSHLLAAWLAMPSKGTDRRPFSVTLGNFACSGLRSWGPPLPGELTHESCTGNKTGGGGAIALFIEISFLLFIKKKINTTHLTLKIFV